MRTWMALLPLTLLLAGSGAASAQDVALPVQGTAEYNLAGTVNFESGASWLVIGRYAPFTSPNLQWGIDLTVLDGPGISTSGFIGGLLNWHFPSASPTLPYIGVGLSAAFGDLTGSVFNVHGGIKHFITSAVAFTAELQWLKFSESSSAFGGGKDSTTQLVFGFSLFH